MTAHSAGQEPISDFILLSSMKVSYCLREGLVCFLSCAFGILMVFSASSGRASTVWTGPTIIYSQPTPDPTQVSNQDRITPIVWLTRATSKGLFNAYSETSAGTLSPADTEWAFGTITNYASLNYTNWLAWLNGQSPVTLVGKQAVLHLISEDIYISFEMTAWSAGGSGGFTYERSTSPPLNLSGAGMNEGQFSFSYNANPAFTYIIQSSPDLLNWTSVATNVASSDPMSFSGPANSVGTTFYRVMWLSTP
jgi:hypothetical protein